MHQHHRCRPTQHQNRHGPQRGEPPCHIMFQLHRLALLPALAQPWWSVYAALAWRSIDQESVKGIIGQFLLSRFELVGGKYVLDDDIRADEFEQVEQHTSGPYVSINLK